MGAGVGGGQAENGSSSRNSSLVKGVAHGSVKSGIT